MLIDSEKVTQRNNISSNNLGKRFSMDKVNSSLRTAKGVADSRLFVSRITHF